MSDEQGVEASGTTRRRFVQAAAAAGAVGLVWSEPIIRGTAAGATTGGSVNGKCTSAFIQWSNDANNWMANDSMFSNASTASDNGSMTGDTPPPIGTYTWAVGNSVCPTLTANVTVTATNTPEVSCTVAITSGESCVFQNISTTLDMGGGVGTGGTVSAGGGTSFTWTNAPGSGDNPIVIFDIVC